MKIEVYEYIENEKRTECRTYEIEDGCDRVLVDRHQTIISVWGFIPTGIPNHPRQTEGRLIDINPSVY